MKRLLRFLPFLLFAGWLKGYGQQILFNITSSDSTSKSKFFFQHQTNFYSWKHLQTKKHLVYESDKKRY